MKKFFEPDTIKAYLTKSRYRSVLEDLQIDLFLMQYEEGELVTAPFQEEVLLQIVVQGSLNIYFIRYDGARYSLSSGGMDYILGDTEVFYPQSDSIYTEAAEPMTCVAVSIDRHRNVLLNNPGFLRMVGESLSAKIQAIAAMDAAPSSLTERVLSYMKYKCEDGVLRGLEQEAFHLHCSSRQLQRVMNQCERNGFVEKIGKGAYKLAVL